MVQPQFQGQTYGEGAAQERRVQAVPTGAAPTQQRAQQAARRATPAAPGSLTAPSARPMEPITAGAPFGPGVGPVAAGIPMMPPSGNDVMEELKAIYQRFPNDDLADLLDSFIREGY
jgi:predicted lipid-binding transport protein (Tim44 family)